MYTNTKEYDVACSELDAEYRVIFDALLAEHESDRKSLLALKPSTDIESYTDQKQANYDAYNEKRNALLAELDRKRGELYQAFRVAK